jgi:membrane protease YdiL (CAAX protease family)
VVWIFCIEKKRPERKKTEAGGFKIGLISGLAISGFVLGAAVLMGKNFIDGDFFREMMTQAGLNRKTVYVGAMLYWVFVNSILEEYVWRWFVVRQFSSLFKPTGAIVLSALGFTLHHILAMQVYFSWPLTLVCSFFIFIGGTWWSWMFLRYKTIWPGWVSHALVDIAVFGYGYLLIF